MKQLPLPLRADLVGPAGDFIESASNAECVRWLRHSSLWPDSRCLIVGAQRTGKSTMLNSWAAECGGVVIHGADMAHYWPDDRPVALDDADLSQPESLFFLINHACARRMPLLMASRRPVSHWDIALPDLVSRIKATLTVAIGQPDEALLDCLIIRFAADRQLVLTEAMRRFLVARLPREISAVHEAVSRIDRAVWSDGGRVTRAILEQIVAELADAEPYDINRMNTADNALTGEIRG